MKNLRPLKIITLITLLTAVCGLTFAQTPGKVKVPGKQTEEPSALLYKITGNGLAKPSYIFGTIHIICEADMLPKDKLNGYVASTDRLILELDMDDPAVTQAMALGAMIPGGKPFTDFLTAEERAKVDEMFKTYMGASVENLKTFKPFLLQAMLATRPKIIGCPAPGSYETTFVQMAADGKKPVEGLETVEFQFAMIDKTPIEKQAKDLAKMAQDPQKAFDQFKNLLAVYKLQDSNKLYAELDRQMETEREFQTRLVDERNKSWIPRLETAMKEKPSFIAVGGGHLGGQNGVLNLLKAKGYKIEPIKL